MAMLPISSTIHAHIRLTGPRIRRAQQAEQRQQIKQAQQAHEVTFARWSIRWLAVSVSLLPHRLPFVTRFDAFWDTWAVRQKINRAQRPGLRRGLAIERRHVLTALQAVRDVSSRASWPATPAAADGHWRAEVRDLLERLGVVIETTTDWHGVTHFTACDLTPARRACLTQPSLDALLFDADEPAAGSAAGLAERLPLSRPHDATTQPALPAIQI